MSDMKSKFPDLKELSGMATKLFSDVKNSVTDIIKTYKQQRETPAAAAEAPKKKPAKAEPAKAEPAKTEEPEKK